MAYPRRDHQDEILTSREAQRLLKIGRTKLWELVRAGAFPAYRIGQGRNSSLRYRRELQASHALESKQHVIRFPVLYRNLHLMVITSFLGLALTGMILKFSYTPWARFMAMMVSPG